MASTPRKTSSSNEGFFQTTPTIPNQFHDDVSFQRILKLFLPVNVLNAIKPDLADFGQQVLSKQTLDWVVDSEKNVPYLKGSGRDAFGKRTSELVVGEGWRKLQEYGISQGIVAAGYDGKHAEYSRVVQYLKAHLWTGSCANVTCPSAMTDGAAKLLSKHLSSKGLDPATRPVLQDAYDRLTSRDPRHAWTSGQWMTERKGGSDVSGTETIATHSPVNDASSSLGPWNIDGFKWFSSATDSSMTILLAQTPNGLSAFFAPMRRPIPILSENTSQSVQELNGIFIQRLKNKFGTKSLPTAELELSGTRAHLIGKEGQGIQEISTILNISRLWSALSAVGYLGRGLAIAKAFASVREVGAGRGKRVMLKDTALHMNTLAKITGDYHAMMLFTFFVASLVGMDEHPNAPSNGTPAQNRLRPDNPSDVPLLLRVLTSVLKAAVCKRSIHSLQECMEALGGVGYLDNVENEGLNIARLYRDCCVLSIWEGTTDVLASDTVRVLKGRNGDEVIGALDRWVQKALGRSETKGVGLENERKSIAQTWGHVRDTLKSGSAEDLLPLARNLVFKLADIVMGVLLVVDAELDANPAIKHICSRYLEEPEALHGIGPDSEGNWKDSLELNQRIVYGSESDTSARNLSKL